MIKILVFFVLGAATLYFIIRALVITEPGKLSRVIKIIIFAAIIIFEMSKNLVIVESPAKAKTIEKFLGKEFKVASSFGHIADLPSKELGVDVEQNFTPNYIVSQDKTNVVN